MSRARRVLDLVAAMQSTDSRTRSAETLDAGLLFLAASREDMAGAVLVRLSHWARYLTVIQKAPSFWVIRAWRFC
jgi:hypothetical protein